MIRPLNFNPQGSREPRRCCSWKYFLISCKFQSTRLSRASTLSSTPNFPISSYFNPQGSREPRRHGRICVPACGNFNPQGSREPRLRERNEHFWEGLDFNPQGSREPRPSAIQVSSMRSPYFNPQGSREPRLDRYVFNTDKMQFQSTRLSRASTLTARSALSP